MVLDPYCKRAFFLRTFNACFTYSKRTLHFLLCTRKWKKLENNCLILDLILLICKVKKCKQISLTRTQIPTCMFESLGPNSIFKDSTYFIL